MRGKKFALIIRSYHKIVSKEETAPLLPRLNQPIHPIKGRCLVALRQRRTIEGRVEVNHVDAFIREVLPVALNLKVVTVIRPVVHMDSLRKSLPQFGGGIEGGGARPE